jgi:hypothetical protein
MRRSLLGIEDHVGEHDACRRVTCSAGDPLVLCRGDRVDDRLLRRPPVYRSVF